jgi:dihydroceramide fatty acyl 2-hydroxylase
MAVEITPDASGAFSIVEVKPSGVAALAPPTLAAVAASRASTASPLEQARTDKPTTCRMFETPIIEGFSRVHPVMPFVFWLPILGFFIHASFTGGLAAPAVFVAIVGGVLTWSLTEYVLHRWVFHFMTPTYAGRRFYFVLHGVHHDFQLDTTRLVMPLGVSIPMGVAVYWLLRLPLGPVWIDPIFVGFGIGYLAYDGIHYATHHFRMTSRIGGWLKRYHMVHHNTGENARWGVSSPLWDLVFGTTGAPLPARRG